jgi:hypothetical protein
MTQAFELMYYSNPEILNLEETESKNVESYANILNFISLSHFFSVDCGS